MSVERETTVVSSQGRGGEEIPLDANACERLVRLSDDYVQRPEMAQFVKPLRDAAEVCASVVIAKELEKLNLWMESAVEELSSLAIYVRMREDNGGDK